MLAWRQFEGLWVDRTGLASATPDYGRLTPWDMGSVLAALYSARELGLLDSAQYRGRMTRTLETLRTLPLFRGEVFNKVYDARTRRMIGRGGVQTTRGYSWSATDLGRLLLWLAIVSRGDAEFEEPARRIVARLRLDRVVADGYLHGEELSPRRRSGVRRFQEGRIGYEQYAARGFALWGQDVRPALDLGLHADTIHVYGVPLLADRRGLDRLTSEPLVLLGLEAGWTPAERALAVNVLRVQQARHDSTGVVTIASEDAMPTPPHFFYYYCVYCSGKPFVIEAWDPGMTMRGPRWVSTKATFAWHALLPSEYTALALRTVAAARSRTGWSSGVMEGTTRATRSEDLNTAAVILEAAAYVRLGRPLLREAVSEPPR